MNSIRSDFLVGHCETEETHLSAAEPTAYSLQPTAYSTYDDVVLIVTPKHNIVAQVLKDSIGIWVGIWDIKTTQKNK